MAKKTKAEIEHREKVAKWVLGGIVVTGVSYLSYQGYQGWKAKQDIKEHGSSDCEGVNLSFKADKIYDAFWQYVGGTMEDEETAVSELEEVSKDCMPALALIYNKKYGKNLYQDFTNYVQGEQFERIRHLIE